MSYGVGPLSGPTDPSDALILLRVVSFLGRMRAIRLIAAGLILAGVAVGLLLLISGPDVAATLSPDAEYGHVQRNTTISIVSALVGAGLIAWVIWRQPRTR